MLPHVGGNWNNGAHAGSFAVNLNNDSGNSNQNVGARSARFRYISLPSDGDKQTPVVCSTERWVSVSKASPSNYLGATILVAR
jgi:hypothetical protein